MDTCPDCGVPGIDAVCPQCGLALDPEMVDVFVTSDGMLLAIVKSAFDAADLPYIVQGEGVTGLFPLGPLATGLSTNLLAATLRVPGARADEARALLEGVDVSEVPPE